MIELVKKDLETVLKDYPGRLIHSIAVSEKCAVLASHYKVDVEKARLIGLLHDYTKKMDLEAQRKMILKYNYNLPVSTSLYHGLTASIVASEKYKITDKEILEAVRYHSTGCMNPSIYTKIVMIADLTEEKTRTLEISEKLRKVEFIDLDRAVYLKLVNEEKLLKEKGLKSSQDSIDCMNSINKEV